MRTLVPLRVTDPKTRLSPVLSADERVAFTGAMCRDVLAALRAVDADPVVLATDPLDPRMDLPETPVVVDDRPLTAAVNARFEADERPMAVVMADLPLADPGALERLFATDGDVVLLPGRGGGTNALVTRHPDFRVDYHGASYRDHRAACDRLAATVAVVDSFRLSTDIDEPTDLVEVLLHGDGAAADWLREAGFSVAVGEGRVDVSRE